MILAGDVGGTKTVLALVAAGPTGIKTIRSQTWASAQYPSLEAICDAFLAGSSRTALTAACFGVPGAVVDGACRTTNLPWLIREDSLRGHLGVEHVALLNDLQAAGYGMLHLGIEDFHVLQEGHGEGPLASRPRSYAVIAPGTGLGEGLLVWTGSAHLPVPSEGGHSTFAPQDTLELALRDFIAEGLGAAQSHVSWERVLSGPGLANIYAFLRHRGTHAESAHVAEQIAAGADVGMVVGTEAVTGTDPLCAAAVELFAALLGAEASNLALKGLTTGGVLVGGGIAPRLLPILARGSLMRGFLHKGRFAGLLRDVPVLVALNDRAPVIGAAAWAARRMGHVSA